MQVRAECKERHGECAAPAERAIAEEPGHECAHERGERKNRRCARGANAGLRLEIQAQAEPVADCADQQQERTDQRAALAEASRRERATTSERHAPSALLTATTANGGSSDKPRVSVLSSAQQKVAKLIASNPSGCSSVWRAPSMASTAPPVAMTERATTKRAPNGSRNKRQAKIAVNIASKLSSSEPLVAPDFCKPQANAAGPIAAPKQAISAIRGPWRRTSESGARVPKPLSVHEEQSAPAYSSAAVVNGPTPRPKRATAGAETPNESADSAATRMPVRSELRAGMARSIDHVR